MALTKKEEIELLALLEKEKDVARYRKVDLFFPDQDYTDPFGTTYHARHKYQRFLEFFEAGSWCFQRAIISANQVGKSNTGIFEVVQHATGDYKAWWKGRRFEKPVNIWICGDRAETIRDSLQSKLIGQDYDGKSTGLLPDDKIEKLSFVSQPPNVVAQYKVRHKSGGLSTITIKTYQAGRTAFEAAVVDVILLDEECPRDIYSEALTRTINSKGIIFCTFTPDSGITDTYSYFMDRSDGVQKHVTHVTWDDVPHLTEERKKMLLASYSPQERECRSKGLPYLGKGKVYQHLEDNFVVDPFKIPDYWPRVFGMDVGSYNGHPTACAWLAHDRDNDIVYLYSEYKVADARPPEHAAAIISRGIWIPGVIDNSSQRIITADSDALSTIYSNFGIWLNIARKGPGSVEAGIYQIDTLLSSGRFKVFRTCGGWIDEYRFYRRDDKGKIVKTNDDLMDATRYAVTEGLMLASVKPQKDRFLQQQQDLSRNKYTGY